MPRVERAGIYQGSIQESGIQVNREGERVTSMAFVAKLSLTSRYNTQEKAWEELGKPQEITAFLNLIKGDGTLNETQWASLEKALNWTDGREKLAGAMMDSSSFAGCVVNATIEMKEYKGKSRLQVSWLNPTSGVKSASGGDKDAFAAALKKAGIAMKMPDNPFC
jgi:hypothetical protein